MRRPGTEALRSGAGSPAAPVARILVRAPNPLGDAVMAEPAVRAIGARFPGARLDVQIRAPLAALVRAWPGVAGVLPVDGGPWRLRRLTRLWQPLRLRRSRFDLCVLLPNGSRVAAMVARARIPRRVGYAGHGRAALLTDPVPLPPSPRALHMIEYYWALAAAVGVGAVPGAASLATAPASEVAAILGSDPRTTPRIEPTPVMRAAGRRLLASTGLGGGTYVVLAPGAAYGRAKRWPAEHFAALGRALARDPGWPSVILGAADERALGAEVVRRAGAGDRLVDLTGRTDLETVVGILAGASLFVGNDSGLAHVAAALGCPGVTLFGSTSPRHSGPVGPRMRILQRPLPCAPCFARDCPLGHLECLAGVSVATVAAAAREALRPATSGVPSGGC